MTQWLDNSPSACNSGGMFESEIGKPLLAATKSDPSPLRCDATSRPSPTDHSITRILPASLEHAVGRLALRACKGRGLRGVQRDLPCAGGNRLKLGLHPRPTPSERNRSRETDPNMFGECFKPVRGTGLNGFERIRTALNGYFFIQQTASTGAAQCAGWRSLKLELRAWSRCGRSRSKPSQGVAQTRFLTGSGRVWPGLPGFARVKFLLFSRYCGRLLSGPELAVFWRVRDCRSRPEDDLDETIAGQ
jgi:hypothetical protein